MLGKNLIQAASGAAGGGEVLGIEDVFSTYLYTGNGSTQTITNGIDLSGEGGLVWIKCRNLGVPHALFDTQRGATYMLQSQSTAAQALWSDSLTAFNSTGFALGADTNAQNVNVNTDTYASWTFRKAEKFFDVVTGTSDSSGNISFSHSLGSTPGCVIVRRTDSTSIWYVFHRSTGSDAFLRLNTVDASTSATGVFSVSSTSFTANIAYPGSVPYVAYLFAHDAGGFGDGGTESVIKCGSFTTDGSGNATVDLGWEPQWVLAKRSDASQTWWIGDVMRGMTGSATAQLYPNASDAEFSNTSFLTAPTATGFTAKATASATYIYIAIRRGPMKTPTSGTEVFAADSTPVNGSSTVPCYDSGFPVDLGIRVNRSSPSFFTIDRLRGNVYLKTETTGAELFSSSVQITGYQQGFYAFSSESSVNGIGWMFRRAPGFFDVVAYTGNGVARTVNHNLGVVPELMIVKQRSGTARSWLVYASYIGATKYMYLNLTNAASTLSAFWDNTTPTDSVFTLGTNVSVNGSGANYIAYLFATCPGVSKVGSYTGTGTTLNVDCGFASGARFVLIKRTDSTGDWYVWDTARGIVSGNDPYLLLNSTAAEVTSTDYIDPLSSGFQISSTAPAAINASGGSFIFLAIA
jgi:hypothetical protein